MHDPPPPGLRPCWTQVGPWRLLLHLAAETTGRYNFDECPPTLLSSRHRPNSFIDYLIHCAVFISAMFHRPRPIPPSGVTHLWTLTSIRCKVRARPGGGGGRAVKGGKGVGRRVTYSTYSSSFASASLVASGFNTYLKKRKVG